MTIELTYGERKDLPLASLVDSVGNSTTYGLGDVLRWTAKFDYGDPVSLFAKTSVDDGITIGVGTDGAVLHMRPVDYPNTLLVTRPLRFVWDVQYLLGGDTAEAVPLDSGDGLLLPSVTGAPTIAPPITGGVTCTPWATHTDVPELDEGTNRAELDYCMQLASDWLFIRTGKRYRGICVDEIFPAARRVPVGYTTAAWVGSITGLGPSRFGWCACNRTDEFGCSTMPAIKLPGYPAIRSGIVVTIDGQPFAGWQLRNRRTLVRVDGAGWPCCQNRDLEAADGTWSIRYPYGVMPPAGGVRAAAVLGGELYKLLFPQEGRACQLAEHVVAVSRAGVSQTIQDPTEMFKEGFTGNRFVDLWLAGQDAEKKAAVGIVVPGRRRHARLR